MSSFHEWFHSGNEDDAKLDPERNFMDQPVFDFLLEGLPADFIAGETEEERLENLGRFLRAVVSKEELRGVDRAGINPIYKTGSGHQASQADAIFRQVQERVGNIPYFEEYFKAHWGSNSARGSDYDPTGYLNSSWPGATFWGYYQRNLEAETKGKFTGWTDEAPGLSTEEDVTAALPPKRKSRFWRLLSSDGLE